jgi:hypothetical protein
VERAYQQTVRCADEIHLAGLPSPLRTWQSPSPNSFLPSR